MIKAQVDRLVIKGLARELAEKLVQAGLDTPARIKAASDRELRAVQGIGKAAVERIRELFPAL